MALPQTKIPKSDIGVPDTIYRYVIDHDMGFAPNPFHGYCTMATCKPVIRRCGKVGDFVLGFGSANSNIRFLMIYWMKIEEISDYNSYWNDDRFQRKKPVENGGHLKFHGDNIYHKDRSGSFIQEPSFHSLPDGNVNYKNLKTDTGSTDRLFISKSFGYYGRDAIEVPHCLSSIVAVGRGHRTTLSDNLKSKTVDWLLNHTRRGFVAEPSGWASIGA